ncbi:39S ribosomal protein L32, mitochondrial isoform X1 [Zootermopsis nevadensis]|uniref:Large ribosomal subunit protein bL32m n=1 Tax=Zootermopsis nevadensis TaxID=136037 RepID=A0A067QWR1_ZOONE|nr:39S ribosomal protein L32, mitochondrial isoform X1 [Zootermopsis nevadensis]KDR14769.1 39S ribosomal protein L32, mitochondrial [Zootermopsis nevadensis]
MAASVVWCLGQALKKIENVFALAIGRQFPPHGLCMVVVQSDATNKTIPKSSLSPEELFRHGFLWAVPYKRRSLEKRLSRKFGYPEYVYKLLLPKRNLLVCNTCGHHHEAGHLCPHCYAKVRSETEAMQSAIQEELGLSPVEQEVVVLYGGEKVEQPAEYWKGKRIIEMKKERPSWFSKNLLEKSTVQPSSSSDVKPTELA